LIVPCNEIIEIPAIFSTPISEVNFSIDVSENNELITATIDPCNLTIKLDLDHIKLIRHDGDLAKISHDNSFWSILMDPPMPLLHARNKIAEITCLGSFKVFILLLFNFILLEIMG
jgi:hypothetical protein